ncbi:MAG: hypothetical protein JWN43_5025, partial [Gammaproteobacteria bacterium]|nr:hypothetical protein [Gammaproteobacteria bacterium]
ERSYLDLGAASLAIDAAEGDTASHAMTAVEPQLQDTAVLDTDMLETVVIEPSPDLQSRAAGNSASDNAAAVDSTALDYDLLDLDATAQHVQMPSELHDHVVVRERRTSIVDVLKSAIDRDPHRSDLRMKLLETYYSVAATNQRAFVDVVKKLAGEREFLSAGDWQKVMMMGREIASDDLLFSDLSKDADLADCA